MISASRLFFLLSFLFVINLHSQDKFENQFMYAKKLYDDESYFDAVTEFKRLLLFDSIGTYSYTANYYIALSYKAGGFFSESIRHFTLAELSSHSVEEVYSCRLETIKLNILRRSTDRANRLLDELSSDARFVDKIEELNYWRGWSLIFSDDWKAAETHFSKIDPEHRLALFSKAVHDSLYNVNFAKIISYIIPGAGQIYLGEYLSGSLSLGWNVLFGYLTVNAFVKDRIFDGFAVANFLWLRFYNGNIYNAEKFAKRKNNEITNRALDFLQYEYTGQKP